MGLVRNVAGNITQHMLTDVFLTEAGGNTYVTTAKAIQASTNSESYDKTVYWSSPASGKYFTWAAFLRMPSSGTGAGLIMSDGFSTNYRFLVAFVDWDDDNDDTSNIIRVAFRDTAQQNIGTLNSLGRATHGIAVGDWFALMVSGDYTGATPVMHVYVHKKGDASATNIEGTWSPLTGPKDWDFTPPSTASFGESSAGTEKDFEISEIFFDGGAVGTFVDWSDSAERDKFVDSNGKPIGLGADGSDLHGSQPGIYAPDGDLTNNLGFGGNWTEVGTISDAGTSPSD